MALNTPKRMKTLSDVHGESPNYENNVNWNWFHSSPTQNQQLVANNNNGGILCTSPATTASSENKRGRPKSEELSTLMVQGSISPSAIKCRFCHRVFPREKSLQAHLRTHTGERPHACDYPGCTRAFTQSGQLKTHQRLHTGERPFICSAPHCQMRFTHANRHCPDHPYDTLKRCDDFVIQTVQSDQNGEVMKWLEKYRMEREDRTPTRKTPKRVKNEHENENQNENCTSNGTITPDYPLTPSNPYKSRKGLMCELDMNAGMGSASPLTARKKPNLPKVIQWQEPTSQEEDESGDEGDIPAQSTFNPKKKWLREAWQDDLARPLEPVLPSTPSSSSTSSSPTSMSSSTSMLRNQEHSQSTVNIRGALAEHKFYCSLTTQSQEQTVSRPVISVNPNQMRPTVLMVANKDKAVPLINKPEESNRKWLGALALMQLATDKDQTIEKQHEEQYIINENCTVSNDRAQSTVVLPNGIIHSYSTM